MLARLPRLTAVVAHMGAPEYAEFLAIAETNERVYLDTTMVFTDFFEAEAPYPPDLAARLVDIQPKVLLGSDFPTIPYPYAHQLEGLERLDLGDGLAARRLLGQRRCGCSASAADGRRGRSPDLGRCRRRSCAGSVPPMCRWMAYSGDAVLADGPAVPAGALADRPEPALAAGRDDHER